MFKGALTFFRNNVKNMLHAAWQNEITLSFNFNSIQFKSFTNDVYSYNMNII